MKPAAVAVTVVDPLASGSSATPPVATVSGEELDVGLMVTVRLCAPPACVTSWAAVPLLLVTVTTTLLPPGRMACSVASVALPGCGTPRRTKNSSLTAVAPIDVARFSICSAGCTTPTSTLSLTKPGADAVIVTVPVTPSCPCTTNVTSVAAFATGTSMKSLPTAAPFAATFANAGLLLAIRTVTPPCPEAPRRAVAVALCSPLPTAGGADRNWMPGVDTVTVTVAALVAMSPGIVADTVVLPAAIGSNATPPSATDPGDPDAFAAIVTVRDCAEPACVVSCATAGLTFVTVEVSDEPARTAWIADKP